MYLLALASPFPMYVSICHVSCGSSPNLRSDLDRTVIWITFINLPLALAWIYANKERGSTPDGYLFNYLLTAFRNNRCMLYARMFRCGFREGKGFSRKEWRFLRKERSQRMSVDIRPLDSLQNAAVCVFAGPCVYCRIYATACLHEPV